MQQHWLNRTKYIRERLNMNYSNNAFNGRMDVDEKSKSWIVLSIVFESQLKFDCCLLTKVFVLNYHKFFFFTFVESHFVHVIVPSFTSHLHNFAVSWMLRMLRDLKPPLKI